MPEQRSSADPRLVALQVIEAVERGEDLQHALSRLLTGLEAQDRHLATQLSYGFFRLRGRLEHLLSRFIRHKWKKLPKGLRRPLALGAYELLSLDRIPPYATVSWYVGHVRRGPARPLAGLANAVLRGMAERDRSELLEPGLYREGAEDEADSLSRYYSCPRWIVQQWLATWGRTGCETLLQATLEQPPVGLRINCSLPEAQKVMETLGRDPGLIARIGSGVALSPRTWAPFEELMQRGVLSRQSLAAQEALLALKPERWGEPVWDACAGRGGKTAMLRETGLTRLWASDTNPSRLGALPGELQRLRLDPVALFRADASRPPLRRPPGSILIDAPCSGLGVISRRPDLKWKRQPGDVAALSARQMRLLAGCAETLRPGGRLLYMTCTLTEEENEGVIQRFLREQPAWTLETEWRTPIDSPLREFFYTASLCRRGTG